MKQDKALRVTALRVTAIAGIAAAGIAVMAFARPGTHSASAASARPAVAWMNHPVALPASIGRAAATTTRAAACTAADLSFRQARRGFVEYGAYAYIYAATNTGTRACRVSGYPDVAVAGKKLGHTTNLLGVSPGTLARGASATFAIVQATGTCATATPAQQRSTAAQPRLTLSGGTRTTTLSSIKTEKCEGQKVTPIGLTQQQLQPASGPLAALTVKLSFPRTVVAGKTATFTVTLTNPTSHKISLAGGPRYEMGVSASEPHLSAYKLSTARTAVPAHASISYAMRYTIPASTQEGPAKVSWFLLNGARTGAGAVTIVTG